MIPNSSCGFFNKKRLPMYYNNVRSIVNKRNVNTKIELSPYKILCFTETFLDENVNFNFPDSFNVFRCDRAITDNITRTRRASGVAVLVHKSLQCKSVELNTDPVCEFLAIEIVLKPKSMIIYLCYMSIFDINIANKHYERIKLLTDSYPSHRLFVLGDFNLKNIAWEEDEENNFYMPILNTTSNAIYHTNANDFLMRMLSLPMFQLSNVKNSAGNVLDLVFVNDWTDVSLSIDPHTIIDAEQQDEYHRPYDITIDYCARGSLLNDERENIPIFCYQRGNYKRMCQQLDNINFTHEFNIRTTDEAYEFFLYTMNELILANVPRIVPKKYANKPKWWNRILQQKKNRRDKLYKRQQKGTISTEYIAAAIEFNTLHERYYNSYIQRVQENIKNDPATFWQFAKLNNNTSAYPNKMKRANERASSPDEIVELFANQFESSYVNDEREWNPNDIIQIINDATEVIVTLDDIDWAINSLKWKSGAGPDKLSPFVIKMCIDKIVWPIWLLFQKTFDDGQIPAALKLSRVVPVFKKGDKSDVSNYRVVAISSVILKIFEIAVKSRLMIIIEPKLSNAQHGFRPRRSVTTNLLNLSIDVYKALQRGNQIDIFYGDFKDAFNAVCHRILVSKMNSFGLGSKTIKWLYEFIAGRMSFVKIGKAESRKYRMSSGVPAGSTLGPILFLMFINDLPDVIQNAKVLLFADDSKMFLEIDDQRDTAILQTDINNMMRWCHDNMLPLNINKCNIFSASRAITPNYANYSMAEHIIERKETIRDLGVILDRRFSYGDHIEQTTLKCRQLIGCIKRHSIGKFTTETQRILYLAYVRSRLEFASVIWNPYQQIYIDDIESIQKQFVIYLLDSRRNATSFRLDPYIDRCKLLKLQTLVLRRKIADSVFAFDIFKGEINDVNISSNFVIRDHHYATRRARLIDEPFYNTDYLRNQPIARLIQHVNQNNAIFRNTIDRKIFKRKIEINLTDIENE